MQPLRPARPATLWGRPGQRVEIQEAREKTQNIAQASRPLVMHAPSSSLPSLTTTAIAPVHDDGTEAALPNSHAKMAIIINRDCYLLAQEPVSSAPSLRE